MTRTKLFAAAFGAIALAAAGFGGAQVVGSAEAQGRGAPVILIVNQAQVLAESRAGQSIQQQVQAMQAGVKSELEAQAASIEKEGTDLEKQKDLLSQEVLQQRARNLMGRQQQFQGLREVRARELQIAQQRALAQIGEELEPILKEIVDKRGATLLLDRSAVMYAANDTDVTDEVLKRLDKELKSVKVEKVNLKDEIARAQQNR